MGKEYACDGMFKFNVDMNKTSTSIYIFFSTNFWHARLCHINDRYVEIISSLGLIPIVKNSSEKCEACSKAYNDFLNDCENINNLSF